MNNWTKLTEDTLPEDGELIFGYFPDAIFKTRKQRLIYYRESERGWFLKNMTHYRKPLETPSKP